MLWIWTTTGNKQLMNVKTLKCMQRQGNWEEVEMKQCKKTSDLQNIQCTKYEYAVYRGMEIEWSGNLFLHLPSWSTYAVSKLFSYPWLRPYLQLWSSAETSCETSTAYKGKQYFFKF